MVNMEEVKLSMYILLKYMCHNMTTTYTFL